MVASNKSTLEEVLDIENNMALWVLNPPEPPSMLRQVLDNVKDILIPHPHPNTVYSLRNQPFSKRAFAFFKNLFPILASFQNYNAQKFKCDFMAGLTLAIFAIPQVHNTWTQYTIYHQCYLYVISRNIKDIKIICDVKILVITHKALFQRMKRSTLMI